MPKHTSNEAGQKEGPQSASEGPQTGASSLEVLGPDGRAAVLGRSVLRLDEHLLDLLVDGIDQLSIGAKAGFTVELFDSGGDDEVGGFGHGRECTGRPLAKKLFLESAC